MHPKSFVSNFWGAVHIQSATLFFEILHIVGGYGIPAVAIRVQLINHICYCRRLRHSCRSHKSTVD